MSELRPMIERYDVELRDLNRVYALPGSNTRHSRLERFHSEQLRLLEAVNFDALSQAGKIDYLLLRGRVLHDQKQLAAVSRQEEDIAALIPSSKKMSPAWKKRGGEWRLWTHGRARSL